MMKDPSRITLLAIMLIMLGVASNLDWGDDRWKGTLEADAKGYYAYLPAIFIYNDLNFGFFDEIEKGKYYDANLYYDYRTTIDGKVTTKYYCGTAVAQLPFFLIAHGLALLTDHDADGYSKPYGISLNFAALFWLFVGLHYLDLLLRAYGSKGWIRTLVLIATLFGTNLFYYSAVELGMAHVYSFGVISAFAFYARQYFETREPHYLPWLGIMLGMTVLIRPVDGLVILFLPFLAGSADGLWEGLRAAIRASKHLVAAATLFLLVISIQLVIYQISIGTWLIYAYGQEGFNFRDPHFLDILFSYKKGLFLYTPLYLIALLGFASLWRRSKYQFFSMSIALTILIYVLASWWMWYYGGSFSSRVFVEFLPFFMLLLALALGHFKSLPKRFALVSCVVLLTLICQIQTYQYRYYQIHWSDMDKERYWDVFLRIDELVIQRTAGPNSTAPSTCIDQTSRPVGHEDPGAWHRS